MSSQRYRFHDGDTFTKVMDSRGAISRALTEVGSAGGPELDFLTLAEQARVSTALLDQLDQGLPGPIDLRELERLCWILGRSPNDLLGYEADIADPPQSVSSQGPIFQQSGDFCFGNRG